MLWDRAIEAFQNHLGFCRSYPQRCGVLNHLMKSRSLVESRCRLISSQHASTPSLLVRHRERAIQSSGSGSKLQTFWSQKHKPLLPHPKSRPNELGKSRSIQDIQERLTKLEEQIQSCKFCS
jgi:hypothetical protein